MEMENASNEQEVEPSSVVYELPGEPAIVINGMPEIPSTDGTLAVSNFVNEAESHGNTNFGDWLEGREVKKLFGEQLYSGTVTEYDKETTWYRVVYEDGDFEDLDWTELEPLLQPLDIMIPLKALALKTLRRSNRPIKKSGNVMARSQTPKAKAMGSKGKKSSPPEKAHKQKKTSILGEASAMNAVVLAEASVVKSEVPEDTSMMNTHQGS